MMKRLFATAILIVALLLSSTRIDPVVVSAHAADITTQSVTQGEEKLTINLLKQMPSWDELVKTALPISNEGYGNIENLEDRYSVLFIRALNEPMVAPIYHNTKYIATMFGGIRLSTIDVGRLMEKFHTITSIYNGSNELQIEIEPTILNDTYMQVNVMSTNTKDLNNPATYIGEKVTLKSGTKYWESSWNDGSGSYGIATDDNPQIPDDFEVFVNGVAYLDEDRITILTSNYVPYSELENQETQIKVWEHRMLHICTENADLGWVYAEDVVSMD